MSHMRGEEPNTQCRPQTKQGHEHTCVMETLKKAHTEIHNKMKGGSSKETLLNQYNHNFNNLHLRGISVEQTKEEFVRYTLTIYLDAVSLTNTSDGCGSTQYK